MTSMVMIHRLYCGCNLDFAGNSISYLVFISEQFCGYKFHLAINTFIHLKRKPFRRTERTNSTQVQLFGVRIGVRYVWLCQDACKKLIFQNLKGSADPSHFIFEINVGKSRIRHSLCHIERLWNWISRSTQN